MAKIIEITDFSDPALDVYARLTENQLVNRENPAEGLFIAESPNVILRALAGGYEPVSLLLERKHIETQAKEVVRLCGDIPIYTAELPVLVQLTGFPLTRGVLCAMRRRPLPSVEEVCKNARRVAILEDVMNPTNLGAIFRSAAALGMDAVLLTPACTDPLYRRAIRVSMGTVFQVPWTFFPNTGEATLCPAQSTVPCVDMLKNLGFRSVAMALKDDSLSIDDPRLAAIDRLAIVLGTEGDGLADQTIAACDHTVRIPMMHNVDSLNVAAAAAVAFWELRTRNGKP